MLSTTYKKFIYHSISVVGDGYTHFNMLFWGNVCFPVSLHRGTSCVVLSYLLLFAVVRSANRAVNYNTTTSCFKNVCLIETIIILDEFHMEIVPHRALRKLIG